MSSKESLHTRTRFPAPRCSSTPAPVSAAVKRGGAARQEVPQGAVASQDRSRRRRPALPRVAGASPERTPGATTNGPEGKGTATAAGGTEAGCTPRRRQRSTKLPLQNSTSRRRPAPSTHFYICAPFQSSVTCPAPRPISEALWSGQWKRLGQSVGRLAWRQPMGTGLC